MFVIILVVCVCVCKSVHVCVHEFMNGPHECNEPICSQAAVNDRNQTQVLWKNSKPSWLSSYPSSPRNVKSTLELEHFYYNYYWKCMQRYMCGVEKTACRNSVRLSPWTTESNFSCQAGDEHHASSVVLMAPHPSREGSFALLEPSTETFRAMANWY